MPPPKQPWVSSWSSMESHMPCLALSLVIPAGNCAELLTGKWRGQSSSCNGAISHCFGGNLFPGMQVLSWVAQLCTSGLEVPDLEPPRADPCTGLCPLRFCLSSQEKKKKRKSSISLFSNTRKGAVYSAFLLAEQGADFSQEIMGRGSS